MVVQSDTRLNSKEAWWTGMYEDLSPPIASTMLACIALGLAVCPFVFFFYGPRIRARSKVASSVATAHGS